MCSRDIQLLCIIGPGGVHFVCPSTFTLYEPSEIPIEARIFFLNKLAEEGRFRVLNSHLALIDMGVWVLSRVGSRFTLMPDAQTKRRRAREHQQVSAEEFGLAEWPYPFLQSLRSGADRNVVPRTYADYAIAFLARYQIPVEKMGEHYVIHLGQSRIVFDAQGNIVDIRNICLSGDELRLPPHITAYIVHTRQARGIVE